MEAGDGNKRSNFTSTSTSLEGQLQSSAPPVAAELHRLTETTISTRPSYDSSRNPPTIEHQQQQQRPNEQVNILDGSQLKEHHWSNPQQGVLRHIQNQSNLNHHRSDQQLPPFSSRHEAAASGHLPLSYGFPPPHAQLGAASLPSYGNLLDNSQQVISFQQHQQQQHFANQPPATQGFSDFDFLQAAQTQIDMLIVLERHQQVHIQSLEGAMLELRTRNHAYQRQQLTLNARLKELETKVSSKESPSSNSESSSGGRKGGGKGGWTGAGSKGAHAQLQTALSQMNALHESNQDLRRQVLKQKEEAWDEGGKGEEDIERLKVEIEGLKRRLREVEGGSAVEGGVDDRR
jgi:hypothetical protein